MKITLIRHKNIMLRPTMTVAHGKHDKFDAIFHFHPEIELNYIIKGTGYMYIGTQLYSFSPNELVLIDSSLPHCWISSANENPEGIEYISIHIPPNYPLLNALKQTGEFDDINRLFRNAKDGIIFKQSCDPNIQKMIKELPLCNSFDQLIKTLSLFQYLSLNAPYTICTPSGEIPQHLIKKESRLQTIYNYTLAHYTENIKIENVAAKIHLTNSSFCKYFKQRTQTNYIDFLNNLRINHAKKLLIDTSTTIKQIAYSSGFESNTYFNRIFKNNTNLTPLAFRKDALKRLEKYNNET